MSKLNVDQKTIKDLLSNNKADFLIPDYQRPYAWDAEKECQTLWEDIFTFAFPDDDFEKFDRATAEYYLGPIVTFKNDNNQMEIIDGQQRLTTIMLLLRAFYSRFDKMKDAQSQKLKEIIGRCIWKTNEFDEPDMAQLKIDSEVATDNDKVEFLSILKDGLAPTNMKSRYAENFRFFLQKIEEFVNSYPAYFPYLPSRILNNCILLPIEADMQDTALRIFSTLNNRGKALSDADIFKAEFYKHFSKIGQKDKFIERWRNLDAICERNFHPQSATPMDELFTRYMYYERAKQGKKNSTTEALRTFYSANGYALLKTEETLSNMELLADFWDKVLNQDDCFSERVRRLFFILNYAPNSMWTFFVSVYFMQNKDVNQQLDDEKLFNFLRKIIGFIWAYAITNPGVNALRTPVYAEMVNVVTRKEVTFSDFLFPEQQTRNQMDNYNFYNGRPITRSLLVWWAMQQEGQVLPNLDTIFEIEHIYARNRNEIEHTLSDKGSVEKLGNKAILEKRINIRASDYRFTDKLKYYNGFTTAKGEKKEPTIVQELLGLQTKYSDFQEEDINNRTDSILSAFCSYLKEVKLIK
ncbi:MAG: DUF262 domain-containing protein [Paludibacteraceae bacterium]|nr:DUF262 domain-containing protein [Paludibacteraceae bacterium]